jgi:hypothetical protein
VLECREEGIIMEWVIIILVLYFLPALIAVVWSHH